MLVPEVLEPALGRHGGDSKEDEAPSGDAEKVVERQVRDAQHFAPVRVCACMDAYIHACTFTCVFMPMRSMVPLCVDVAQPPTVGVRLMRNHQVRSRTRAFAMP
jgi:hypothetical protein